MFTALALLRVVFGFSLRWLLAICYGLMLLLTYVAPETYTALAYDAGSVTTGVLTTPVVLAVAFGLSSVLAGRSAISGGRRSTIMPASPAARVARPWPSPCSTRRTLRAPPTEPGSAGA